MTPRPSFDLDSLTTCIVLIDEHGVVDMVNQAAQVLLETSSQRATGSRFEEQARVVGDGAIDWHHTLANVVRTRLPAVSRDLKLALKTGRDITVDVVITPLNYDRDSRILLEISALDRARAISETENLREAQQRLQHVVKGMAHEVKNPLGGIRGAAQLMARKFEDRELDEYANIIISEVDRLQALVDRMLGPRESLDKRSINIHEVTERVRQLIEAEALDSVKVIRDYDPSLPEFLADSDQLTQAILNIVRNALEAAEADSQITIKTRSRRQFTLNGQRHKLVCAIDIIDDGPGIPDDLMTSIFLPMVTSRPEGSGLGLSIAQLILTRHGGVIQAISQPGNTCFTLLLPMEP